MTTTSPATSFAEYAAAMTPAQVNRIDSMFDSVLVNVLRHRRLDRVLAAQTSPRRTQACFQEA
jgi:hypothetical protein